ncbi:hypothetical protein T4A_13762 [Trichinella pseudospiralis]|uniref:Uncharacterized protein n=1 Tax=Trichinella pseudospiralis TaxID=6337 RepID=A0A0V1EMQ6_TRIPS|nr:hypothetical protein T4A_13762 [Trichinella pseudospiralis]
MKQMTFSITLGLIFLQGSIKINQKIKTESLPDNCEIRVQTRNTELFSTRINWNEITLMNKKYLSLLQHVQGPGHTSSQQINLANESKNSSFVDRWILPLRSILFTKLSPTSGSEKTFSGKKNSNYIQPTPMRFLFTSNRRNSFLD